MTDFGVSNNEPPQLDALCCSGVFHLALRHHASNLKGLQASRAKSVATGLSLDFLKPLRDANYHRYRFPQELRAAQAD